MAATSRAGLRLLPSRFSAFVLALLIGSTPSAAHPMPDTQIIVTRNASSLALVIRLPFAELLLALPPALARPPQMPTSGYLASLRTYFAAHTHLLARNGVSVPVTLGAIRLLRERNPDVGDYAELEVRAYASVDLREPITLRYDGVLHRVINHRALVFDRQAHLIGIIPYSLAKKRATPLLLPGRAL